MAGQVRAAMYTAVGAVRRRQVSLECLDRRPRRRAAVACHGTISQPLTHECLLATNTNAVSLRSGVVPVILKFLTTTEAGESTSGSIRGDFWSVIGSWKIFNPSQNGI